MLSTVLEVAGFGLVTAGSAVVGGLAAGLFVGGGLLVLCGYATEDHNAVVALNRLMIRPRAGVARAHTFRVARRDLRQAARLAKLAAKG